MKTKLTLIWALCLSQSFFAQNFPSFIDPIDIPCYDSTLTIQTFEGWEAYQTMDNTKDGIKDSTICINIYNPNTYKGSIYFDEFDENRPVFLKYTFPENTILEENAVFSINQNLGLEFFNLIDTENDLFCNDSFCDGAIVRVEAPIAPGDSVPTIREYQSQFGVDDYFGYGANVCFPSEYFEDGNRLIDYTLKIPFLPNPDQNVFEFFRPGFDDFDFLTYSLDSASILQYNDSQFVYWFSSYFGLENNFLVRYEDELEFPSVDHVDYLDLYPIPNVDTVSMVNLQFGYGTSLTFQPFTELRGGLIEGSDSIRHNYNIEFMSGNICMYPFLEVVISDRNRLTYYDGEFDIQHNACVMLKRNATLEIAQNSHLEYGKNGVGMIALFDESNLVLNTHSSFEIDNQIILWDTPWLDEDQSIEIHLVPYSEFSFGPSSRIDNRATNHNMKMRFHMEGGKLDLAGLSEEDLKHIELVYPENNQEEMEIQFLQNPVDENLKFSLNMDSKSNGDLLIFDTSGRQIISKNMDLQKGVNFFSESVETLSVGVYTLKMVSANQSKTGRFVKR